jgi:hypothetical protein
MPEVKDEPDDFGLADWCALMGLAPNGEPLPAMEQARRAHEQMLAEERAAQERPKYKVPFYKLPFARDLA